MQSCLYQMMTNRCHFSTFNKSVMLRLKCTSIQKMKALLMQEINPLLTKPTQWRILMLKVVFLWIILSHLNDGISSSILVNLFIQMLLVPGMRVHFVFDSRSQKNLITVEVVKQLGLSTKPHSHPYNIRWLRQG